MLQDDDSTFVFDMNCDLIKRFFGAKGLRRMRIDEFSSFFLALQEEIGKQAFAALIESGNLRSCPYPGVDMRT